MKELEIIGALQSTYVRTVRIACEEKKVPYRLTQGMPHSPEVIAIHPLGKIPVMRHGDFRLCESKAIVTYIDRVFPGPKLLPDDAVACAKIEQWVSMANTTILPVMNAYLQGYYFPRTADGRPDRISIDKTWPDVHSYIDLINHAVTDTNHLVGSDFTYADMSLLPVLAYLRECPDSGQALKKARQLAQYFDRHSKRASFKATVPPPFSELTRKH
jgi:glutathione S-transferase